MQVAVWFKFTFEAKTLRIHLLLDVLDSKGFKRSQGPCPRVNRIYHSLDEVLGESLNAIAKCRFKEQTDGFGKFMLFLH